MSKKKYFVKKRQMLMALQDNLCRVSVSAKQAGIDRATHYRWMNNDPEYNKMVMELKVGSINSYEAALDLYIRKYEQKDIMFILSKRGSSRGYSSYKYGKKPIKIDNEYID